MNYRKFSKNMDEKFKNIVISAAYNDLAFLKKRKAMQLINENEEAAKLYKEHCKVADSLTSLKDTSCPEEIVQIAKSKIFFSESEKPFVQKIYLTLFNKPVATVAVTLSVVLFIALSIFNSVGNSDLHYTQEQIAIANKQTEQALAIVGKVFLNSQRTLESNILGKQVGYPIKSSIYEINNLFNKGE